MEPWRAPIASLLARHNCTGVYLDFGSNIGVQIRKLFEPHKFEGAQVLPLFTEVFGEERCRTCAIGIEPNPRHTRRLDQLESRLGAVGAGVLVLRGAATTSEGSVHLALPALGTRATQGSNPELADFACDHSPHAIAVQCIYAGLLLTRFTLALDR